MLLTAEQHYRVATVYENAAADMRVPPPHRTAFARKADWFRMLARIRSKSELASLEVFEKRQPTHFETELERLFSVGWTRFAQKKFED